MRSPRLALLASLLAFLGLCLAARRLELVEAVELKTLDWRFRRFSPPPPGESRVALLMLDQQSLDHFEAEGVYWPWPRSLYAAVADFCRAAGAKAVVFDVLFTSPSPYGVDEDKAFAQSLRRLSRGVLAMEMGGPRPGRDAELPERFALGLPAGPAARRESARIPVSGLAGAAALLGDAAAAPDLDGVFRRLPLLSEKGGRLYPSLAAAAVLAASESKTAAWEGGVLTLGDHRVPLPEDGRLLVRYSSKPAFPAYPLGRAIESWSALEEKRAPSLDPAELKDKIVLVGLSAPGLKDLRPSPVSPVSPGTEIVAFAVDNILRGDFLRRGSSAAAALMLAAAVLGAAGAVLFLGGAWVSVGAAALLSAGLAGAAVWAFGRALWLDMALPQAALWLSFAGTSAYGYAVEGRKKRHIQKAFAHYLAPEVVADIAANPERLVLGGERRELTCYFSDIENFTTISEGLPPERLTYLMNRYLGEMTDTVLESKGTLDKYIGDAIMAFWGAPVPRPDHALAACKVALANQKKLVGLRRALEAEGFPPVRARIGLNSGTASVGNMGSASRFSYTALGDDINLASRLEGANKTYGTFLLISHSTREAAGAAIEVRELDLIKVKGKNKAVRVYELLGLAGETDPALTSRARAFEAALALYRARRWAEASSAFTALLPDAAAQLYVERCSHFQQDPPPADWDGSYASKEK